MPFILRIQQPCQGQSFSLLSPLLTKSQCALLSAGNCVGGGGPRTGLEWRRGCISQAGSSGGLDYVVEEME